jgi:hypothetical protein
VYYSSSLSSSTASCQSPLASVRANTPGQNALAFCHAGHDAAHSTSDFVPHVDNEETILLDSHLDFHPRTYDERCDFSFSQYHPGLNHFCRDPSFEVSSQPPVASAVRQNSYQSASFSGPNHAQAEERPWDPIAATTGNKPFDLGPGSIGPQTPPRGITLNTQPDSGYGTASQYDRQSVSTPIIQRQLSATMNPYMESAPPPDHEPLEMDPSHGQDRKRQRRSSAPLSCHQCKHTSKTPSDAKYVWFGFPCLHANSA